MDPELSSKKWVCVFSVAMLPKIYPHLVSEIAPKNIISKVFIYDNH